MIELYEKLTGNNLFIKIACLKDNLEYGDILQFFEHKSENSSDISKDYYDMDVCKYLIKCSELSFDDLLLINRKNILTIFSYNEEFIEEEMSKINIYKISKKELISRLEHKIAILEQENSYLKKIRLIEKAALRKAQHKKNTN